MKLSHTRLTSILIGLAVITCVGQKRPAGSYPTVWFSPINDPNKPDWEILPQEAKAGEVILSKRNELGILSNFAATPFELYGKRYASVEGFWQMMLYPEGPDDERAKDKRVTWKTTREQVAQMIAKGISPIEAAEVAICSPITDDRELQRSIREIITTII